MSELCAYHESGHAVCAILLGASVHRMSIDPDPDDGPRRDGDVEIHWPGHMSRSEVCKSSIRVSLAGPAAEMIYSQEPLHPATVPEWRQDWETASMLASAQFPDAARRTAYLEDVVRRLYADFSRDDIWQAIASLSDEILAHEHLEADEIHDCVSAWI
ncbi:MAG: cell division protein FtsH [Aureliella sp.]